MTGPLLLELGSDSLGARPGLRVRDEDDPPAWLPALFHHPGPIPWRGPVVKLYLLDE